MIEYNPDSSKLSAKVKNKKTGGHFTVSTVKNPLGVYETAVFETNKSFFLNIMSGFKPLYVVNAPSFEEGQKNHIRTAELFEQLNPKDLIRKY